MARIKTAELILTEGYCQEWTGLITFEYKTAYEWKSLYVKYNDGI